jgi:dipeptidyl aminopeptidase/acylaminoacyl peptidase
MGDRQNLGADLATLISPVTHVTKNSVPVLLLHGTQDALVPMAQSELLLEKYRQAGAKAELVKIEGGAHAFWNAAQFDQTMKLSLKFFRETLAATPASPPAAQK